MCIAPNENPFSCISDIKKTKLYIKVRLPVLLVFVTEGLCAFLQLLHHFQCFTEIGSENICQIGNVQKS